MWVSVCVPAGIYVSCVDLVGVIDRLFDSNRSQSSPKEEEQILDPGDIARHGAPRNTHTVRTGKHYY